MRITSGVVKGYKLKIPQGGRVRPAQDIVRQAIFNMLGESIIGARVLDLFAGSGSLGIEALSRGAAWCDFVDKDKKCTRVIKENLRHTHFEEKSKAYTMSAERFIDQHCKDLIFETAQPYDFVLFSPPYAQGIDLELVEKISQILRGGGLVVFEHAKEIAMPKEIGDLNLLDQRTYGAAKVSFLQKTFKTFKKSTRSTYDRRIK